MDNNSQMLNSFPLESQLAEHMPVAAFCHQNWVCWRAVPQAGGKTKKLPISPITGGANRNNEPSDWGSFQQACDYLAANPGLAGLGFVFTQETGMFFVDIDDALHDGKWNDITNELIARLPGAFVEVSQSGRGVHIIGTGTPPAGRRCKSAAGFDIYPGEGGNRFVALTGTQATGIDGTDLQTELNAIFDDYLGERVVISEVDLTEGPREDWSGPEDDAELLKMAMRSASMRSRFGAGVTFKQLWECDEDALGVAYPHDQGTEPFDHSRADAALLQHLAFWTGCNAERMDRLFRQSGLMRDKWDERNYAETIIRKTIGWQVEVYQDAAKRTQEAAGKVAQPPVVQDFETYDPGCGFAGTGDHEIDARAVLTASHGRLAIENAGALRWWNGRAWQRAEDRHVKRVIANAMTGAGAKTSSGRINGTADVLRILAPSMPSTQITRNVFFNNGALDPLTGAITPHSPANGNTSTLSVEYIPGVRPAVWERWLLDLFEGEPERVELLQEMMGWCLCNDNLGIQKAMCIVGPKRAGKGTVLNVLQALLSPEQASPFEFSTLNDCKTLASIKDAQVAIDADAGTPKRDDARGVRECFLKITAGDAMSVKMLYTQTPWTGRATCKILTASNRLPGDFDDSGAMAGRWIPLVFSKTFFGKEDPALLEKLIAELPAIAAWAVEGLRRLAVRGRFVLPESSLSAMDSIESAASPLLEFVEECLLIEADGKASSEAIYSAYVLWAVRAGITVRMDRRAFLKSLAETLQGKGPMSKSIRIDGGVKRGWEGVRIRGIPMAPDNVIPLTA
ncbi:phage/plasmid primase, P4 family [Aeromonas sp. QDB03]|uniref:phage/plasmid primase, P4 family n=1 Tax=Aeromonas sp. QDB03 TaxID=2989839 RepID=UPI0022E00AE9|nr:phage/plasmid primase, P4 family [Aeromonas sp. QDB03]